MLITHLNLLLISFPPRHTETLTEFRVKYPQHCTVLHINNIILFFFVVNKIPNKNK